MLTQRLVEAAAENDSCGNDIISDFVKRGGGPYKITDQIIRIAASNPMPLRENPRAEALVMACRHSTKAAEMLLEHGASANIEDGTLYDPTPLGNAVHTGRAETVRLLIQHGASINRQDLRWRTPLLLAAQTGSLTIVRELLKCGQVDVNLPDDQNNTPFLNTVTSGRLDIIDALLTHSALHLDWSDLDTALRWGARLGHLAVVDILIGKWGAQVNSTSRSGQTALIWAAQFGHVAVVERLIDNWGAGVNVSGANGRTALMLAAKEGHSAVVDVLLKHEPTDRCLLYYENYGDGNCQCHRSTWTP
ncbi:ankyrin repeat-containing domain protein [Apodospora peruviana]|uniref:Ankyrin repeat-containing domain protein n=1 Tax=Apodospora peruviana TaxID=516989 RepID=A0AAE0IJN8_9PEZI|nr:ankyrin repeat-containing domain protein [Apodospora peruviana]